MKLRKNQTGTAHLVAILLVVFIVIVGVVGWKVWDNGKKNDTTKTTSKTEPGRDTTTSTDDYYLKITELGVKLKLTQDTKDMTYHLNDTGNAVLSSTSLAKEEPKCAADYTGTSGVGIVGSFTDPEGSDQVQGGSGTNAESFPDAVKVGTRYYFVLPGQSYCVDVGTKNNPTDAAFKIESTLVKALRSDITLEKL